MGLAALALAIGVTALVAHLPELERRWRAASVAQPEYPEFNYNPIYGSDGYLPPRRGR